MLKFEREDIPEGSPPKYAIKWFLNKDDFITIGEIEAGYKTTQYLRIVGREPADDVCPTLADAKARTKAFIASKIKP